MRIFASKTYGFRNPSKKEEIFCTKSGEFQEVPEWVRKDPMFLSAQKSGGIEIIITPKTKARPSKALSEDEQNQRDV